MQPALTRKACVRVHAAAQLIVSTLDARYRGYSCCARACTSTAVWVKLYRGEMRIYSVRGSIEVLDYQLSSWAWVEFWKSIKFPRIAARSWSAERRYSGSSRKTCYVGIYARERASCAVTFLGRYIVCFWKITFSRFFGGCTLFWMRNILVQEQTRCATILGIAFQRHKSLWDARSYFLAFLIYKKYLSGGFPSRSLWGWGWKNSAFDLL